MRNKKSVAIWKWVYAAALVLTFISWCALMIGAIQSDQTDDIFGSNLTLELGVGVLLIVLVEELIIYMGVKYFLQEKITRTRLKTAVYTLLLALDFLIILLETRCFLSNIIMF